MAEAARKVLDPSTSYKTEYCIPLWLRDEQIKLACALPIPRVEPDQSPKDDPIAIVCFGPSLQDTWEEIKKFKRIISCSGSHKFLLERGIVPTWHVEVDPRIHKVTLLGPPHPDVHYLPASTCHPSYFKHLLDAGSKVSLWHIFSTDAEAHRVLPRGEWALTGGSNVGLRAMTMAAFFGYRDQHIFGMDGNQRDDKHKHAAPHPVQDGGGYALVDYEGTTYKTTTAMYESAKQTFHELDMLGKVKATFYGEGLVQAMAKNYAPKELTQDSGKHLLAFTRPELISAEYRDLNAQLHQSNLAYGVGGGKHAPEVMALSKQIGTTSILDYGCGKGYLARELPFPIWEYDPAIPEKSESPRPADIVCCLDVLEHVEPERILFVLDDLRRVTKKVGYFTIHTGPSSKTLADGRNAHILQRNRAWWEKMLKKFFLIGRVWEHPPILRVVVAPRPNKAKVGHQVVKA